MMHTWFVKSAYVNNISIQKKCYNCPVTLYGTWNIMDWHGLTNKARHDHLLKKIKKMQYWLEDGKLLSVYITSKVVCFSNIWSVSIMHSDWCNGKLCLLIPLHSQIEVCKTCTTESCVSKALKFINISCKTEFICIVECLLVPIYSHNIIPYIIITITIGLY